MKLIIVKFAKDNLLDEGECYDALISVNDDLDFILTDKTVGEAATKVRMSNGDGWVAFYRLHR